MTCVSSKDLLAAFHRQSPTSRISEVTARGELRRWGLTESDQRDWLNVPQLWHCKNRFEQATDTYGSLSGRSAKAIDDEVYGLATVPQWDGAAAYAAVFGDDYDPPLPDFNHCPLPPADATSEDDEDD